MAEIFKFHDNFLNMNPVFTNVSMSSCVWTETEIKKSSAKQLL